MKDKRITIIARDEPNVINIGASTPGLTRVELIDILQRAIAYLQLDKEIAPFERGV